MAMLARLVRAKLLPARAKASTCQRPPILSSLSLAPLDHRRPHGAKPLQPAMPPTRPCRLGERICALVSAATVTERNLLAAFAKWFNRARVAGLIDRYPVSGARPEPVSQLSACR